MAAKLAELVNAVLDARTARRPNESSFIEDVNCSELVDYVAEHLAEWTERERLEADLVRAKRALSVGTKNDRFGVREELYLSAQRALENWLMKHVATD